MRLGDLDALKKALEVTQYNDIDDLTRTERLIDNAPTVEPCYQTTSCLDCKMYDKEKHNCPRFCEVIKEALEETKRPQGEWIITKDEKFYHYKCPFCGFWATGDFLRTNGELKLPNFCERCGADLRGKEE